MITAELRRAIRAATGAEDPLLRPGPAPGRYVTAVPFRLAPDPGAAAARLASQLLEQQPWIANAEVTGSGFVTATVTHATLARLAIRIAQAWPAAPSPRPPRSRSPPHRAGRRRGRPSPHR